jgi:hypothetical protein
MTVMMLAQQEGNLDSILQPQLSEDDVHLISDGELREAQPLAYLLVGQPLGYQECYLLFLMSKVIHPTPPFTWKVPEAPVGGLTGITPAFSKAW